MRRTVDSPAWVPKRMVPPAKRSSSTRWIIREPAHLLIWWAALLTVCLVEIAVGVIGLVTDTTILYVLGFGPLVMPMLLLGADLVYVPRALAARRAGESWTPPAAHR